MKDKKLTILFDTVCLVESALLPSVNFLIAAECCTFRVEPRAQNDKENKHTRHSTTLT